MTDSPFVWRRRVAMREVDGFGVVWYGNYLGYCDEARAELMRGFGLAPSLFGELGYAVAVVEASCRYHAPARFDDDLAVAVRIAEVKGAKMRFSFSISRAADRTLLCEINTTLVLLRGGELVFLMPEPFKAAVRRILAEQPSEAP